MIKKEAVDTTPEYWDERAKRNGKVSVARKGYDNKIMQAVTDKWWKKLKPVLLNSGNLLEIGCGWGRWASRLTGVSQSYTGVDVSQELVNMNDTGHDIRLCKPGRLSFDDDAFDTILTITVLQHVTDKVVTKTASEIDRVLTTDGRVILVENINPKYRTQQEYVKLFKPHIDIEPVGHIKEKGETMVIFIGWKQ